MLSLGGSFVTGALVVAAVLGLLLTVGFAVYGWSSPRSCRHGESSVGAVAIDSRGRLHGRTTATVTGCLP
jgi:hypothetical protein